MLCSTRNTPVGVETDALPASFIFFSASFFVAAHVRNSWPPVRVCAWSNTTSGACFPPDFELKMAQGLSYLHVPHSQLKCSHSAGPQPYPHSQKEMQELGIRGC